MKNIIKKAPVFASPNNDYLQYQFIMFQNPIREISITQNEYKMVESSKLMQNNIEISPALSKEHKSRPQTAECRPLNISRMITRKLNSISAIKLSKSKRCIKSAKHQEIKGKSQKRLTIKIKPQSNLEKSTKTIDNNKANGTQKLLQSQCKEIQGFELDQFDIDVETSKIKKEFQHLKKKNKPTKTIYVYDQTDSKSNNEEAAVVSTMMKSSKRKQQSNSYYERMRQKIQKKISPLLRSTQMSDIQTDQEVLRKSQQLNYLLQEKEFMNKMREFSSQHSRQSNYKRASRTGLDVTSSHHDKARNSKQLFKIQNQMALRDQKFQKMLMKNCESIMCTIDNYESQQNLKMKRSSKQYQGLHTDGKIDDKQNTSAPYRLSEKKQLRRVSRQYYKDHPIVQKMVQSKNVTLQKQQAKQAMIGIQIKCQKHKSQSRNLEKGMKIFQKYTTAILDNLESNSKKIEFILLDLD